MVYTVACVVGMASPVGAWIHVRMSDLVPALSELRYDRAGGSSWFSTLKKEHIRLWTGLKRKEELYDEHGIVFQYPDFAFLLTGIKSVGECEHVVSLDCV